MSATAKPKPSLPRRLRWLVLLAGACGEDPDAPVPEDARAPCERRSPLRDVYFGDLHVHTGYSFDASIFEVRTTPADAYRFARGEAVPLSGGRTLRLDRPLDFTAVTDHSEFLGEVEVCTTPGADGYDSAPCAAFRRGGNGAVATFALRLTLPSPAHDEGICGAGRCAGPAGEAWRRVQQAAEAAYDRSPRCSFTSFVAYEYTAAPSFSTLHRNVIFRGARVPSPTTYMEQPDPQGLWEELKATCLDQRGCDALAIPHNANESNGNMFYFEHPDGEEPEAARARARLRAKLEPLLEVYQHKGDSECMNGLGGILGAPDEACDFEKSRREPLLDCGEGAGAGGAARRGCFSSRDFLRGALLLGLSEAERLGENPLRLGVIASTDTHNGTPGAVAEERFEGHRGTDDGAAADRLGVGTLTPGGVEFSPGGLAAVWAEENSREALFSALRRREVYGTSGPRLAVRFFGGAALPEGLCADPELVRRGYESGVPMGGVLPAGEGAPRFVISALRDPGTAGRPGAKLQRVQIVKGWLAGGARHQRVYDVGGGANGATVDPATCAASGPGHDSLCAEWIDPDFQPGERAFYYARVLENPSCRWSAHTCNALPPGERPASCVDPSVPRTVQERAWTSPIWYDPPAR